MNVDDPEDPEIDNRFPQDPPFWELCPHEYLLYLESIGERFDGDLVKTMTSTYVGTGLDSIYEFLRKCFSEIENLDDILKDGSVITKMLCFGGTTSCLFFGDVISRRPGILLRYYTRSLEPELDTLSPIWKRDGFRMFESMVYRFVLAHEKFDEFPDKVAYKVKEIHSWICRFDMLTQ